MSFRVIALTAVCLLLFSSCQRNRDRRFFDEALALWEQEKYEEAIQNFVIFTKSYPEHNLVDDSLFWIANIYEHYVKDHKQAIRFYRLLLKRFENSEYVKRSMSGLARIYLDQGSEDSLRKALLIFQKFQRSVETATEWEKNQYQLAQIYMRLKRYEQARSTLKELIRQRGSSELIHKAYYLIGSAYFMEGRQDLTEPAYLEAEKRFDHSRQSLTTAIRLANIYEEQGHLQSAIKVYRTILNRLEKGEMFYQLVKYRVARLHSRLRKTNTGLDY